MPRATTHPPSAGPSTPGQPKLAECSPIAASLDRPISCDPPSKDLTRIRTEGRA